jgi:hypothetical protein
MTDHESRSTKRLQAQTPTEIAANLLKQRLRAGDLDLNRVELAANCGYPPAVLLLGESPQPADASTWVETIPVELRTLAMIAVVRRGVISARDHGVATRGPRPTSLGRAVAWAKSQGATYSQLREAVGRAAAGTPPEPFSNE